MNLKEQRAAAFKAAQDIIDGAKDRDLTPEEQADVDGHISEVKSFDERIAAQEKSAAQRKAIAGLAPEERKPSAESVDAAKTIGDHFVKYAGERLAQIKGVTGASVAAPEFKAATDTQVIFAGATPFVTEYDRTFVTGVRPRLVVADLLSQGTLTGNAISYFVEGALEGAFTTVAEAGAKPQLHVADPTAVTEALKKIAGFIKFSDEMIDDLDFIVSEINNRLLYELSKFEEAQLLNGNGTGSNIRGILQRSGIQTETAADTGDNADALFRAITKVTTGSGLDADGIVMNPTDYQRLRLNKDGNGQYFGGGYFQGQYGNGVLADKPPVWGLQTVVTPAITAGTALVGSFKQGGTVYRKGGVRVESTNSHASDFTNNLVTVRAEERLALAVRFPAAFVSVTQSATPPA